MTNATATAATSVYALVPQCVEYHTIDMTEASFFFSIDDAERALMGKAREERKNPLNYASDGDYERRVNWIVYEVGQGEVPLGEKDWISADL